MFRIRRTSAAALAASALLLAAGCGGSGDGGDGGGSDANTSSPPKSPSKSQPRSTSHGQGNGRALPEKQADTALLAEGNLPSGWSQADLDDTTAAGDSPDDLSTRDQNCKQLMDALGGDIDGQEAKTDASRSYQKSGKGPYASNKIASYDAGGAKQAFSTFKKMTGSCDAFKTHNNQVSVDFSTSDLTVPSAGDESAGVRARGKAEGGPADGSTLTLDLAVARVGQSTTGVVTLSVDGGDSKLAGDLLKKSADRLQQATDGQTPTPKAPAAQDD